MKKKIFFSITVLIISLFSFMIPAFASENNTEVQTEAFKNEVASVFPEYKELLLHGGTQHKSKMTDNEVIIEETRAVDENTKYSLKLYNDGTYGVVKTIGSYTWYQDSSTSGSGYVSYRGTVIASVYKNFISDDITVTPVAYTLVNQGYDYFDEVGYSSSVLRPEPLFPQIKYKEDSNSPASAMFNPNESDAFVLILSVGNDRFTVTVDGITIHVK